MRACVLQVGLCATAVIDARGYLGTLARGELDAPDATRHAAAVGTAPGSEEGYRLGDCFLDQNNMRAGPYGQQFHKDRWPRSLAVAYMERTAAAADYAVLTDLVRQRGAAGPATTLVVHLRVGDVLDQAGLPLQAFLDHHQPLCWERGPGARPADRRPGDFREIGLVYAQPLRYFETLAVPPAVSEVVIVAAMSYRAPYEHAVSQDQSRQYVAAVARVFQRQGYRVTEHLDGDADEAFLLCARARYFVPSGGGFSSLAGHVAARLGGEVLGTPVTGLGPAAAVRLCLAQGMSLTSLVWVAAITLGRVVLTEHLLVLPGVLRAGIAVFLAGSATLYACRWWRAARLGREQAAKE